MSEHPVFRQPTREDDADAILALVREFQEQQRITSAAEIDRQKLKARKQAEREVEAEEEAQRRVTLRSLDGVVPTRTQWLWARRIPLGEITLVAGKGGIGKSLFLCTLASWITTGDCRGEYDGVPRSVIFVANEDSYEKTVVPRLMAAGADLSRVYRVDVDNAGAEGKLILPDDCVRLEEVARSCDAVAVIIDPLSSNMSDRDRNSPEVRLSYERLRMFAERCNIAVVGNGHTRKGQSVDLLEAIMGSSEIGNVVRAAIGIIRDDESEEPQVILSQCKNNLGSMDLKSYTYRIVETNMFLGGQLIEAPRLEWGQSTDRHVNDILSAPTHLDHKSDVDDARAWLKDYLMINPGAPRKDVVTDANKAGHKEYTLKRAAKGVVESTNEGFPRVTRWSLKHSQSSESSVTYSAPTDSESQ